MESISSALPTGRPNGWTRPEADPRLCSPNGEKAPIAEKGIGGLIERDTIAMADLMQVADMMKLNGRVFLKSEWGQISSDWPCVSFTKRSVGERLRRDFLAGRDILIYVGTTDPKMTELPEHRSRLISAVAIEPNHILATRKTIPPDVWARSLAKWGDRWPHAMAVLDAANLIGPPYPNAREVVPKAYRSFAEYSNRGGIVGAVGDERKPPPRNIHAHRTRTSVLRQTSSKQQRSGRDVVFAKHRNCGISSSVGDFKLVLECRLFLIAVNF
jgi:hypothetical protein